MRASGLFATQNNNVNMLYIGRRIYPKAKCSGAASTSRRWAARSVAYAPYVWADHRQALV
jgi:hypothetical protein